MNAVLPSSLKSPGPDSQTYCVNAPNLRTLFAFGRLIPILSHLSLAGNSALHLGFPRTARKCRKLLLRSILPS